jgi:hypothetical protein
MKSLKNINKKNLQKPKKIEIKRMMIRFKRKKLMEGEIKKNLKMIQNKINSN